MIKFHVDVQYAFDNESNPNRFLIQRWVNEVLESRLDKAELCIRIMDIDEMTDLNETYRKKSGPTNVLSFPSEIPEEIKQHKPLLGDIAACAPVIEKEAKEQNKSSESHWAHMIVHGILHLLGYDHITDTEANVMESLEIDILAKLGYADPYGES